MKLFKKARSGEDNADRPLTKDEIRSEYDKNIQYANDRKAWHIDFFEDFVVLTVSTLLLFGVPFTLSAMKGLDVSSMIGAAVLTYAIGLVFFFIINMVEGHNNRVQAKNTAAALLAENPWLKEPVDSVTEAEDLDIMPESSAAISDALDMAEKSYYYDEVILGPDGSEDKRRNYM